MSEEKRAEFSGRSVEDAVSRAAQELGIPAAQVQYRIIEDTTKSILGLVISGIVTIDAVVPVGVEVASRDTVPVVEKPKQAPKPTPKPAQTNKPQPKAESRPRAEAPKKPEQKPERRRSSDEGKDRNPPELEDVASEVVSTLLDKMGIIAAVEVVDGGGEVGGDRDEVSPLVLNVVGDDLGGLIGRRGETLRDLQFMVRLIVSREIGVWPNVVVDVEGYKGRREETLRNLAQRMADQAIRSQRRVVLEPMPAHERRILHLALRDRTDVRTESTGEGEHRKVQIIPE